MRNMKSSFDTYFLSQRLSDLMQRDDQSFVRVLLSVKIDFICLQSSFVWTTFAANVVQECYNLPIK